MTNVDDGEGWWEAVNLVDSNSLAIVITRVHAMGTGGRPVGRLLHDGIFDSRNLRGCHGNHQRGKRSTSFKSVLGLCLFIPVQHELLLYCGHADLDLVVIFTGI